MMKFIVALAFIGLVAGQARPRPAAGPRPAVRTSGDPKDIQIIRSEIENNGDGTYSYRYELSDGTIAEQTGSWRATSGKNEDGTDAGIQTQQGSFSYVADDGQQIQVTYKADENGYQPQGAHLPVAPQLLEEVVRAAAEHAAAHAEAARSVGAAPAVRRAPRGGHY